MTAGAVETVTVMFTDLVGSTELASRVGPDRAEELRVEHFGAAAPAIGASDGREVKTIGDGLMVVFVSAAAAMACATAIQRGIESRNRGADPRRSRTECLFRPEVPMSPTIASVTAWPSARDSFGENCGVRRCGRLANAMPHECDHVPRNHPVIEWRRSGGCGRCRA